MSARQDSSAHGRGSTDAGRPAGPAPHHPTADGSAWADGSDDGAAAWDEPPLGDASAWGGGGDAAAAWGTSLGPASVFDSDAPAPASSWDDEVRRPRTATRRAAVAPDGEPDHHRADGPVPGRSRAQPDDAPPEGAPRARRARTARAARSAVAEPSAGGTRSTDEVTAVAARLAEIAGGPRTGGRAAVQHTADDEDATGPDPLPSARRDRGGTARRPGGARRPAGGRRRAPASEPPQDGPAAQDAEPDHESVARSVALRLLTGAPKSRHQLAEAMAKRDVPEEVADRVLDRFTEVGLVDDAAYAEILVRSRHTERGLSRRALAQELRRRGVDDETAQEALEQVDDADEEQAARALARKKLRATRGLDRETRLRRAYGALGRRGYGGSLVSRVVREELDAEGAGEDAADDGTGFGWD
jgi:regulatory protein